MRHELMAPMVNTIMAPVTITRKVDATLQDLERGRTKQRVILREGLVQEDQIVHLLVLRVALTETTGVDLIDLMIVILILQTMMIPRIMVIPLTIQARKEHLRGDMKGGEMNGGEALHLQNLTNLVERETTHGLTSIFNLEGEPYTMGGMPKRKVIDL